MTGLEQLSKQVRHVNYVSKSILGKRAPNPTPKYQVQPSRLPHAGSPPIHLPTSSLPPHIFCKIFFLIPFLSFFLSFFPPLPSLGSWLDTVAWRSGIPVPLQLL